MKRATPLLFCLTLLGTIGPALACSLPYAHEVIRPDGTIVSPPKATIEEIIDNLPEGVMDGEVIEHDPIKGDFADGTPKTARMRVTHVWKGDFPTSVTLHFDEDSASCGAPPPVDRPFRMSVWFRSRYDLYFDVVSEMSLYNADLNEALREYQARTETLRQRAESGSRTEQLAFAAHLRRYSENHRALWVYESLVSRDATDLDALLSVAVLQAVTGDDHESEATFTRLRRIAPRTPEWRAKIIKAGFEATGQFIPAWLDWSNVQSKSCRTDGANFDNALFDGSRLGCQFYSSTFRGASFKGADLSWSTIRDDDFTGAKYDCATKLPTCFDPASAGMVNIDGHCNAQTVSEYDRLKCQNQRGVTLAPLP